jgi:hypothetical protein
MANLMRSSQAFINALLKPIDIQIIRPSKDFKYYIPFEETLNGAKEMGLSVGDYIDLKFNVPGSTQDTIDQMDKLGAFDFAQAHVCEIGPGSGRYLVKTIEKCKPEYYEIYETAPKWASWLASEYHAVSQPTDGMKLSATPGKSMDLVHSHKVLNGLKIINICQYFYEMARVVKEHGVIVFDILTEDCLDEGTTQKWLASSADYITSMTAKQFTVDFFARRGFRCMGDFFATSLPGKTHYFVFRR